MDLALTDMNISPLYQWVARLIAPAFLSLVITILVAAMIIYEQQKSQRQLQHHDLTLQSSQLADWLDTNFSLINTILIEVKPDNALCDQETLFELRSMMFNIAPVVEIGIVSSEGVLSCTSWEKHAERIIVEKPPAQYGLRFNGPLTVQYMQQPAFVVARTLSDGSEVNALVRMSWLKNQLRNKTSELGFVALINSETGDPLVSTGHYSEPKTEQVLPVYQAKTIDDLFKNGRRQVAAYTPLATLPDLTLVVSEEQQILNSFESRYSTLWYLVLLGLWGLLTTLFYRLYAFLSDSSHQLKKAISNRELINHYQPIIRSADKKIIGAEVLMRWRHPVEGIKPPATFIPEAQEKGLLNQMTNLQIELCLKELQPIFERCPEFVLTINISLSHLRSKAMVEALIKASKQIPKLALEVTEDVLIDTEALYVQQAFNRFSAEGIEIAIDDFGTGYCGLSYLSQLPVTYLKADKSFVASLGTDAMNADVLKLITQFSQRMKLITIAEGVETIEQAQILDGLGVELHQGWLYSKAIPANKLLHMLEYDDVVIQELETTLPD